MIKRLLIDDLSIRVSHWDVAVVAETDFGCVLMIDTECVNYSYDSEDEAEHAIDKMQDKTDDILFAARVGVDENGCLTLHDISTRVELRSATDRLAVFDGTIVTRMLEITKMDEAIKQYPEFGTW